jgi:hypothetical protein
MLQTRKVLASRVDVANERVMASRVDVANEKSDGLKS